MNEVQMMAAKEDMIEWLEDSHELGKKPSSIEFAQDFELHDLTYYIFRFKKSMLGGWFLGVAGGYEENDVEHCGHVFSNMDRFNADTAIDDATAIVEFIRDYWRKMAESYSESNSDEEE